MRLSPGHWWPAVVDARRLWRIAIFGLALAFVGAFTIAVIRGEPPLPAVQLTANISVEGKLLAHVERFWYVLDKDGSVVAVPEDDVTEVRISP